MGRHERHRARVGHGRRHLRRHPRDLRGCHEKEAASNDTRFDR